MHARSWELELLVMTMIYGSGRYMTLLTIYIYMIQAGVAAVTGNSAWQRSADADKSQGINTMKAASAARDPQQQGMGKVEELAGKAVGCEGMQQEGAESAAATTNTNTTQKKTGEGHTYYSRGENVEI